MANKPCPNCGHQRCRWETYNGNDGLGEHDQMMCERRAKERALAEVAMLRSCGVVLSTHLRLVQRLEQFRDGIRDPAVKAALTTILEGRP